MNNKDSVDDGQEGKGLEGTAEDYLKASVGKSLSIDFTERDWYVTWWMLLDPHPSFKRILDAMEAYKAAFPVADGEKVGNGDYKTISGMKPSTEFIGAMSYIIKWVRELSVEQQTDLARMLDEFHAEQTPALPVADGEGEKVGGKIIDTVHCANCGYGFEDCECGNWEPSYGQQIEIIKEPLLPSTVTGGVKEMEDLIIAVEHWLDMFNKGGAGQVKENADTILQKAIVKAKQFVENPGNPITPLQIWNKAIEVADNVCHNRVNIFTDGGMTAESSAIEICRKEIMQYFNDQYHIKKMLGTEPPEDKGPI